MDLAPSSGKLPRLSTAAGGLEDADRDRCGTRAGRHGACGRRGAEGQGAARRHLPGRAQRADAGARRRGRYRGSGGRGGPGARGRCAAGDTRPAQAEALAARIAPALRAAGTDLLYVDCNAIAPQTACEVGRIVEAAGARFVDAGIIGPPPRPGAAATRFYASGAAAAELAQLRDYGLDVRVIGPRAGDASAVKMCYAALTKGTTAIMTELALAAEHLGVSEALRAEFADSQPEMLERMERGVPAMVPKAHRWVGEMEEIAKTFAALGLTPLTFEGAAALYALVAGTPLGQTSPEDWRRRAATFAEVVGGLAQARSRPD